MDKGLWKNGNHFSQPFFMTYSDGKFPAPVSSRAEERAGMVVKTLGSNETQSPEISCHQGACTIEP
mgnify:CR=1 FL=1